MSTASFLKAYQYTMDKEGWGTETNHPWDPGGRTRYGIAENRWPDMWRHGPPTETEAVDFYRQEFWEKLHVEAIQSAAIRGEVFDTAVLCGPGNARRFLQSAYNLVCQERPWLLVDGIIGPVTTGSVNALLRLPNRERAMIGAQNGLQFEYFRMIGNRTAMVGWCANRLGVGELLPS